MENFIRDLRASVRSLAKKPAFTLVVVSMLAVGIATNTAIFSVVNGVLLEPLPYQQEDRIVTIWQTAPSRGVDREETSPADFFDWQQQTQSFQNSAWLSRGGISHWRRSNRRRFAPGWSRQDSLKRSARNRSWAARFCLKNINRAAVRL